jgi:hypothetical protein
MAPTLSQPLPLRSPRRPPATLRLAGRWMRRLPKPPQMCKPSTSPTHPHRQIKELDPLQHPVRRPPLLQRLTCETPAGRSVDAAPAPWLIPNLASSSGGSFSVSTG